MLFTEELLLSVVQPQLIVVMDPSELGFSMINIVLAMPQIEVQDIDGNHLDDVFIEFRFGDVLGNCFGGHKQDPLEVVELPFILDLDEDDFLFPIPDFQIHTIGFVPGTVSVTSLSKISRISISSFSNSDRKPSNTS